MQRQPLPVFDFTRLDKFLWKLIMEYRLQPTIEFMTTLKLRKINATVWEDLAYQLVSRYIGMADKWHVNKLILLHFNPLYQLLYLFSCCLFIMTGQFGVKSVMKWKFETWNEPDLKGYNLLNFTQTGLSIHVINRNLLLSCLLPQDIRII